MTAPTANLINTSRHISVFSNDKFGKRRVDVLGADAVGSNTALALAMLGIDGIHVTDDGVVEEKDVLTGTFSKSDIGKAKVDAVRELVLRKTGCDVVIPHKQKPDGTQTYGDIVFLCTQTAESRKTIWQKGVKNKMRTKLMIEPRVGADGVRVLTANPIKPAETRAWETSAAKTDLTKWNDLSGPSAMVVAGLSVWQLMRWAAIQNQHKDTLEAELHIPAELACLDFDGKSLDRRVDIIGAGATGSHVVLLLAMLGYTNIHVWDFDTIEDHNLANQAYGKADLGMLKVDAVKKLCADKLGKDVVTIHNEKVDGSQELGEVLFLLTDTMSSRKEIFLNGVKGKGKTKLMIETRMGVDEGRVYTVEPTKDSHCERWEGSLYEDRVAEVSACGASVSVGPTAMFLASFAVWQMMRWSAQQNGRKDKLENEMIFTLRPLIFIPESFE